MISEENFIDFRCPYCEETISFPGDNAGHPQACPQCRETVIVPDDGSGEGRKLPFPMTTERLVLRRFAPEDWQDLLAVLSDEEIYRHMEGRPLEEDHVLHWLEQERRVRLTTPDQPFHLGIQLKENDRLAGFVTLSLSEPFQASLGIVLNRSFQRQGFALEALRAVLGFCFEGVHLHRVSAQCHSQHEAACKLCEKAGMRREGEFVKGRLFDGQWINIASYAALDEEFLKPSG